MNVKKFEFSSEEQEEILKEYRLDHPVRAYQRVLVLKLKAIDGMRSDEVAGMVGISHSSVNKIVNRYQEEGMQAIVGKRHNGEHRYMTNEQEEAFLAPFVALAKDGKIVEITDIYNAYQEAIGHAATRNAIYYILKKHGWRKIMPRGRHPKKASEEAIEDYKKNQ
jgi:transposase